MKLIPNEVANWTLHMQDKSIKDPKARPSKVLHLVGELVGISGRKVEAKIVCIYPDQPGDEFISASGVIYKLIGAQERMDEIMAQKSALPVTNHAPEYHWSCVANKGSFTLPEEELVEIQMPAATPGYQGKEETEVDLSQFFEYEFLDRLMLMSYRGQYNITNGIAKAKISHIGMVISRAMSALADNETIMFNYRGCLCHQDKAGNILPYPKNYSQEQCDEMYLFLKYEDKVFVLRPAGENGEKTITGCFSEMQSQNRIFQYAKDETRHFIGDALTSMF